MSVTQTFDLVRRYAEEKGQPASLMVEVLTEISDRDSIPLKIYGSSTANEEPRQILDPLSISMQNVMGVVKRSISIEPGVTLLYGPNGSGKSTTMRAMLYALFGAAAAGVRMAEELITHGQNSLEATVKFAGGEVVREVGRKVIGRGKNAGAVEVVHSLAVQIAGDKSNKPKEAQALIDGWMGVDGAFVRRVCCLEQGMLTQVMDEQPARRRELVYRLLDLDQAEETRKSLSKALDGEERKASAQSQQTETLKAELIDLRHRRATFPVEHMQEERGRLLTIMSASSRPEEVKQYQDALTRRELDRIQAVKLEEQRRGYTAKADEVRRAPELTMVLEDLGSKLSSAEHALNGARMSVAKADQELSFWTKRGQEIKALPPVCPTCQAIGKTCEVTPSVKEATLVKVRASWIETSKVLAAAKDEMSARQNAYQELDTLVQAQGRTRQRQAFLVEQLRLLQEAMGKMPAPANLAEIDASIADLAATLKAKAAAGNSTVQNDISLLDKNIASAAALDAQIAAHEMKIDAIHQNSPMSNERLEAFRFAVAAFAKDGIPLWLARQHLGRVNDIANELCTLDKYHYSFGADLEVVIGDGSIVISPDLTCGSARERGSVVLMAALGRYLQELSGLSIPLLWIDELPFQDEANAHLVVDMVKRLTRWYPKVVLCASRWDEYLEKFDHEIALLPEDVSIELDRQRKEKERSDKSRVVQRKQEQVVHAAKIVEELKADTATAEIAKPHRQYIALCETHASIADLTKENPIPSKPNQCVRCGEAIRAGLGQPQAVKSVLQEAEDAIAAASAPAKMDDDLTGDCPF